MATQREFIYNVRNKLKLFSDDNGWSDEFIAHLIDQRRNYLIGQQYRSRKLVIPESIRQTIVLPLERVNNVVGMPDSKVIRSVDKIPNILTFSDLSIFTRVYNRDLDALPLNFVRYDRFQMVGKNKWMQDQSYATIGPDDKLYIKSGNALNNLKKVVYLKSVFGSPAEAYKLQENFRVNVDFFDTEYPMDETLGAATVQMVLEELGSTVGLQEDNTNDET